MRRYERETWESEAAMFAALRPLVEAAGWVWHPERGGHDLIVEQKGVQIAVEGKLRPDLKVLVQALPPWKRAGWDPEHRPQERADWYLVVVPRADHMFRALARAASIGVVTFSPASPRWYHHRIVPGMVRELRPEARAPEGEGIPIHFGLHVPGVPAGAPAPRRVTPWKIAAVKLCVSPPDPITTATAPSQLVRTFVARGWLRVTARVGRRYIYELTTSSIPRPDHAYPEIVAALRVRQRKVPPPPPRRKRSASGR